MLQLIYTHSQNSVTGSVKKGLILFAMLFEDSLLVYASWDKIPTVVFASFVDVEEIFATDAFINTDVSDPVVHC